MAYQTFRPYSPAPGAIVVKLYPTGGRVRGYVRKLGPKPDDDTVFPGEEMEPEAALQLARSHAHGDAPILIELMPGATWDPAWGDYEASR